MMKLNNKGNWTLISLLASAAIVIVVSALYFSGGSLSTVKKGSPLLDKSSKKKTVIGQSMDTAKSADCRTRLQQIRLGITTYKTTGADNGNPRSFKDIGLGVSSDYYQCPVSNQPYQYDPATGTVKCPTHPDF